MAFQIESGTGNGKKAGVTLGNRLSTSAVQRDEQVQANTDGDFYALVISQTPTGADDCFCHIVNDNETDLIFSSMRAYVPTDETIQIKLGDTGTPSGGTTGTAINRNAGSGNLLDATIEVGSDITGLSGGSVVDDVFIKAGESSRLFYWRSGIILPKNSRLSFYAVTGAILTNMTLCMYYRGNV